MVRHADHTSRRAEAHLFVNYLMNSKVIAKITNHIGFANANSVAPPPLDASIASDTVVYPPRDQQQRLCCGETEDYRPIHALCSMRTR